MLKEPYPSVWRWTNPLSLVSSPVSLFLATVIIAAVVTSNCGSFVTLVDSFIVSSSSLSPLPSSAAAPSSMPQQGAWQPRYIQQYKRRRRRGAVTRIPSSVVVALQSKKGDKEEEEDDSNDNDGNNNANVDNNHDEEKDEDNGHDDDNDDEDANHILDDIAFDETSQQRNARMQSVRKIQTAFDQDDAPQFIVPSSLSSLSSNNEEPIPHPTTSSTLLQNVPLFRAPYTTLPGYQHVLTIQAPQYTQCFRRILSQPKPWYFGHVYLPDGAMNLSNPIYKLMNEDTTDTTAAATNATANSKTTATTKNTATRVGTLLEITDWKDEETTGHLLLIVQAVTRCRILGAAAQHVPYAIANSVEIVPDSELLSRPIPVTDRTGQRIMSKNSNSNNNNHIIRTNDRDLEDYNVWKDWENFPTKFETKTNTNDDRTTMTMVSPLINYNWKYYPNELGGITSTVITPTDDTDRNPSSTNIQDSVRELVEQHNRNNKKEVLYYEYKVWIELDELIQLLEHATNGLIRIPIPSQLLGLLPPTEDGITQYNIDDDDDSSSSYYKYWPDTFRLESYAVQLEKSDGQIGTHTKSPFVRVGYCSDESYPKLRRASRFSYAIWIILENLSSAETIIARLQKNPPTGRERNTSPQQQQRQNQHHHPTKQELLEMTSIYDRLRAAYAVLNSINDSLR